MTAVACTPEFGCEPAYQWSLVPVEYQGWVFLIALGVAFVAIFYSFYYIAVHPLENKIISKWEPKKEKLYDKLFVELMFLVMLGLLVSFIMMRMGI